MDCIASKRDTFLLVEILDAIEFTHVRIDVVHCLPTSFVFGPFDQFFSEWMFWCKCDEGNPKQCVWSCRKDANGLLASFDAEFDFSTFGTTEPVFLHQSNAFREFDGIQSIKQLLCIFGDINEPLAHVLLSDWPVATPTSTCLDLFISKNG